PSVTMRALPPHRTWPWPCRVRACAASRSLNVVGGVVMYHRLLRMSLFVLAEVDGVEPDRLVIRGANFGARSTPVVLLSRIPLEVLSFSDQQIVAKLPVDVPSARYRLQVLAAGVSSSPLFDVTL